MVAVCEGTDDLFTDRLTRGQALDRFDLSLPITGNLDFRVAATTIEHQDDRITFRIECEDAEEREFWREWLRDEEVDLHQPG